MKKTPKYGKQKELLTHKSYILIYYGTDITTATRIQIVPFKIFKWDYSISAYRSIAGTSLLTSVSVDNGRLLYLEQQGLYNAIQFNTFPIFI